MSLIRNNGPAKTCFFIRPVDDNFNDVEKVVEASAEKCELTYVPCDFSDRLGPIMSHVYYEINRAAVVIADITGHNANVLYELGIAHHIKGQKRVIIITHDEFRQRPFDIYQIPQLNYKANRQGLGALKKRLRPLIERAMQAEPIHEYWNVIRGKILRTEIITGDLQSMLDNIDETHPEKTEIRVVASLGSIAITDDEPVGEGLADRYYQVLLEERNTLIKVLAKGAKLMSVINPPHRFAKSMEPDRLKKRYERLIGLLEGKSDIKDPELRALDLKAIKNCSIVLSPVPMPNLWIMGDTVAYEGMKRGANGGFEMTHCEVTPDGIRDLKKEFKRLFEESSNEMYCGNNSDASLLEQLKELYVEALAHCKD